MSAVSLLVLAVFVWAANREVATTLLRAGEGRAQAAADQLAGLLTQSAQQRLDELTRTGTDPAIRQFLIDRTPAARDAARKKLVSEVTAGGAQRVELWDDSGHLLVKMDTSAVPTPAALPSGSMPSGRGLGPLRASGDVVFYDIAADVNAEDSQTAARRTPHLLGWIVVRRRLIAGSPDALSRLVGGDALIRIGNRTDSVWTDLARVVPRPPIDAAQNQTVEYRAPTGDVRVGALARISKTPWAIWVEFPRSVILAPARRFLGRMIGIGALLLALGWLAASVLSRQITTPLSAMAAATSAIAAGDYSQRVVANRADELGQLGHSFNTMAAEVESMHRNLEARVEERTRDLDDALAQLSQHSETQQAQLAAIVESSDDAIIGASIDGVIRTWNAGATQLYGYSAEDVVGRHVSVLIPPDRPDDARDLLRRVATGEHIKHHEAIRMRKDGTRIEVSLMMSPIGDRSGAIVGVATVARDMTERARLEEQLRQAQKMEAVGRLAGGVAHDFNNLLTAILGYTDLMLEDLEPTHALRGDLQEIRRAGESAASLTQQLLAFSRRQILQPQVLNLNDIVSRMHSLLRRLIGEDIELVTRPEASLKKVSADPGQIEQIVLNLAVNARDAMPTGGKLTIETANVDLDGQYAQQHPGVVSGSYVLLAVSDTGMGMDEGIQAHIFEPFFTTKERGEGTGLGLATVYGIVKQSGGLIGVYSEVAHGTTFKVYLPEARQDCEPTAPPSAPASLRGTETILLAEDQPEVRAVARAVLARHGYTVLEATGGRDALQVLARHSDRIHVLMTDVVMPGMSGRELVEHLQQSHPEIRILYTSGYTDDAVIRHGVLEPGVAFIQKPFTPRALLEKIRDVLDHEENRCSRT